jgi:hypothetical protein
MPKGGVLHGNPNLLPNNLPVTSTVTPPLRTNGGGNKSIRYAPEILSDLLELGELGAQPLDLMLDGGPTGFPNLTKWTLYFDNKIF